MSRHAMAEPYIKYSLGKFVDKGEDAWMQQPSVVAPLPGVAPLLRVWQNLPSTLRIGLHNI